MRQLIFKISLLSLLVITTIVGVLRWNPYEKEDVETAYLASAIDKYHRLDSLKSPKIVLLAGSNFAYGINSEMLEEQLQMPVVNLAIHYNLGSTFLLNSVENKLHKGDILITGFEYILEKKGTFQDQLEIAHFLPEAQNWIPYKNKKEQLVENVFYYIFKFRSIIHRTINKQHFNPTVENTHDIFFRKGFNKYGDLISHLNNIPVKPLPSANLIDAFWYKKHIIADINFFNQKMAEKGVKVYCTQPTYAVSDYEKYKPIIKKIDNQFTNLAKFKLLGNVKTFVYPDSFYQDMVYHLNVKGRNIRTQDLINLLKAAEKK